VTEQQLVAALETTVTLLASPVPMTKALGPVHTAEFSAPAVPLYCWNCTFLI
jgi:hypothetical protein